MKSTIALPLLLVLSPFVLTACGSEETNDPSSGGATALLESDWMPAPPEFALSVKDAKNEAKTDGEIVVTGRVRDYSPNRAMFQLADRSFTPCNERPNDDCSTPWDYCCVPSDELTTGTLLVEFRDGDQPRKGTAKGFHGFDYLKEVVVMGHTIKDEDGNVIVVASKIHVKP